MTVGTALGTADVGTALGTGLGAVGRGVAAELGLAVGSGVGRVGDIEGAPEDTPTPTAPATTAVPEQLCDDLHPSLTVKTRGSLEIEAGTVYCT